jgi:putative SOS response-associated peptidase YedK
MKDDSPFVFAGLWEGWKNPASEEWLHTCTIITGEPNELVAQIHTRMPVILGEEHYDPWLSNQAGKEVLVPFPADAMKAWPISPRVNSPKNNDPELVRPIGFFWRSTNGTTISNAPRAFSCSNRRHRTPS